VLRDLEQFFRRIGTAIDPMRTSGKREVAVGIDHPRDDRGAAGIDDADVRREGPLVGRRTDPDDAGLVDEDAHSFP
jgi:hypothetical protein